MPSTSRHLPAETSLLPTNQPTWCEPSSHCTGGSYRQPARMDTRQEHMLMRSLETRLYRSISQEYLQAELQCQKHVFNLKSPASQCLVPQDECCDGAHVQLHICLEHHCYNNRPNKPLHLHQAVVPCEYGAGGLAERNARICTATRVCRASAKPCKGKCLPLGDQMT